MSWLHHKIRAELCGFEAAVSIAAGDADNDVEMLEIADLLMVRSLNCDPPSPKRAGGMVINDNFGPAGWAEGIEALVARVEEEEDLVADFYQNGTITTLHNLGERSTVDLEKDLLQFSERRPGFDIALAVFGDRDPALPAIIQELKSVPYLSRL